MSARVNFSRENMYRKRPDRLAGASRFASARIVNKAKAMKRESLQVLPKGLLVQNRACATPPVRIWPVPH